MRYEPHTLQPGSAVPTKCCLICLATSERREPAVRLGPKHPGGLGNPLLQPEGRTLNKQGGAPSLPEKPALPCTPCRHHLPGRHPGQASLFAELQLIADSLASSSLPPIHRRASWMLKSHWQAGHGLTWCCPSGTSPLSTLCSAGTQLPHTLCCHLTLTLCMMGCPAVTPHQVA